MAKRIIPCLDVENGRVVKGKQFQNIQDVDDPVTLAQKYNESGADELIFYDIQATRDERTLFLDTIRQISRVITIPLTAGGGIRALGDMQQAFDAGASKVSINSAAVKDPSLLERAAQQFGSERIVLSIDAASSADGGWEVTMNGGKTAVGWDAVEWAKRVESLGAGEIVLNGINQDGEQSGYDLALIEAVNRQVQIPIIASGGAGKMEHMIEALKPERADAVLGASVFHYNMINIETLKKELLTRHIDVRRTQL